MTLGMERGILCHWDPWEAIPSQQETASWREAPLTATSVYKMNSPIPASSSSSRWLTLARVFQILIICLTVGLFIINIPLNYEQRSFICKTESCPPDQVTLAGEKALNRVGISVASFVTLTIALDILVAVTFTTCAISSSSANQTIRLPSSSRSCWLHLEPRPLQAVCAGLLLPIQDSIGLSKPSR